LPGLSACFALSCRPLPHGLHQLHGHIGQTEGKRVHFTDCPLRRAPSLLQKIRHGKNAIEGIRQPIPHGATRGHARRRRKPLECRLNFRRNRDSHTDWLLVRE
jgi:hypothetical protein